MSYDGIDIAKGLAWPLILLLALLFIGMQLNGLALEPHASGEYIDFYQNTLNLSAWGMVILLVFNLHREAKIGEIFGLSFLTKAIIFLGFVGIILSMTLGAGQILPVPRASIQSLQLSPSTELYTSSIIPAFTEDALYLIVLPTIIITVLAVLFRPDSMMSLGVIMVIACLIGATGFNIWVIPGFTSAHVPAYGEVQEAYVGAWIFGFGQSMVYMVTGWFVPVAHAVHNALIAYGNLYQVNIGWWQVV